MLKHCDKLMFSFLFKRRLSCVVAVWTHSVKYPIAYKQFIHRQISISAPKQTSFHEDDMKSGYQPQKKYSRLELIRLGLKELKGEIQLWKEEIKEKLEGDPLLTCRPGEIDILWKFNNPDILQQWTTTSDSDHKEGYSKCDLCISPDGTALFTGSISTKLPKDGQVKRSGYCNMRSIRPRKSFKRDGFYDWQAYNHFVINVRGDGRTYILNLSATGYYDIMWNDVYTYVLFTRGGPYWQLTKIPFSKFMLTSKGRVQDKQCPLPLDKVTNVGISLGDKINGPFSLEIDYIGLEFDPTHTEEFAYEMYRTPDYIAG